MKLNTKSKTILLSFRPTIPADDNTLITQQPSLSYKINGNDSLLNCISFACVGGRNPEAEVAL